MEQQEQEELQEKVNVNSNDDLVAEQTTQTENKERFQNYPIIHPHTLELQEGQQENYKPAANKIYIYAKKEPQRAK